MSLASASQHDVVDAPRSIKTMPSLIELFSPRHSPVRAQRFDQSDGRRSLWAVDAVHRANNLAQLTAGLGSVASRFPASDLLVGAEAKIKALGSAYAKLGRRQSTKIPFACKELLREIVTGLADLFGKPKKVDLCFNGCEIFLPADARRALILIASELVINSLKYAFPDDRPGTIEVSLWEDGNEGQLVVGDDGVGFIASGISGQGSGLISDLGALFGATIGSSSSENGHLVWTRFAAPSAI